MSTNTGTSLLEIVEKLQSQVLVVVQQISEGEWQKPTPNEQWPVGFTVRHIGSGVDNVIDWIKTVLANRPLEFRPDQVNEVNAAFLAKYDKLSKNTEIERLKTKFDELKALLNRLQPQELERTVLLVAFDLPVNIEFLINNLFTRHTQGHLESLQQLLAE